MKILQYDLSLDHIRPRQGSRTTYHWDGTAGTIFLYGSKRRNKDETAVTFTAQVEGSAAGEHRFKNGLIRLFGIIEGPADCKVIERHADKSRILRHLRMIRFGIDEAAWQPQNIDALGDTLCEFEHRSSKHSTDLGHVTVDPSRIVLKQDATPEKQKPYRHSLVLAAKVRTEIDKLSAGGHFVPKLLDLG